MNTDCNMTASNFSILLFPASLFIAIHLPAWYLTSMADRFGNQVDMTNFFRLEAHFAELASFVYIL